MGEFGGHDRLSGFHCVLKGSDLYLLFFHFIPSFPFNCLPCGLLVLAPDGLTESEYLALSAWQCARVRVRACAHEEDKWADDTGIPHLFPSVA